MSTNLNFNNKTFAPLSSCDGQNPVDGYYKRSSLNGVHLYDLQRRLRAYVVCNLKQGYFVVTATEWQGGVRYMHSTSSIEDVWLGLDKLGYMATHDAVKALVEQMSNIQMDALAA